MKKLLSRLRLSRRGNMPRASLILSGALGSIMVMCLQGQAPSQPSQPLRFDLPDLPDNGAPIGRRRGGTSRNDCPALNAPMTALVPGEDTGEPDSKSYLATTISERPTFWVYVPPVPTRLSMGEFVLQDEAGNDIYRNSLTLPQSSGIIGISLPSDAPALETNQNYHWYFKLYCGDPQTQPEYFFVDAWVRRVAIAPELNQPEQDPTYISYATHNLWYDALTALAKRRSSDRPDDQIQKDWAQLLQSVGLQDLAQEAIVDSP